MKEILKPHKFKHFNCGFRYPNTLHTHLRLGRSSLNSHLYEIGQSTTKSCKQCGFHTESCEHYLLDCVAFANERVQLFQKLEGLLEKRPQTYSKKNLLNILLFGEKPYLSEKHTHNKHIFFSVQAFIFSLSKHLFANPRDYFSLVTLDIITTKCLLTLNLTIHFIFCWVLLFSLLVQIFLSFLPTFSLPHSSHNFQWKFFF